MRGMRRLATQVDWHAVVARCSPEAAAAIGDVRSRHAELERLLDETQRAEPKVDLGEMRRRIIAGPPADSEADIAAAEKLLADAKKRLEAIAAMPERPADTAALEVDARGAVSSAKKWYAAVEAQIAQLQQKLSALGRQPKPEDMRTEDILRENPVLGRHIHAALEADDWSTSVPERPPRASAVEGVADAADYGRAVVPGLKRTSAA